MKVLFVRSGNNGIDPISSMQGKSLERLGIQLVYYDIIGKGVTGYLKNIFSLSKYVKLHKPDIIHAHYSFSGFIISLLDRKIHKGVSLMGSDVLNANKIKKKIIKLFSRYWSFIIVKSKQMAELSRDLNPFILPNGVDLQIFNPMDRGLSREKLNWDNNHNHVLFGACPERREKNYPLADSVINILKKNGYPVEIHYLCNIDLENIKLYYNAADMLLLTSIYEGSPNVVKEALACNCPIISTDVGDVRDLLHDIEGCFVTTYDPEEIANKCIEIINRGYVEIQGHKYIKERLSSEVIASKLVKIYKKVLR